MTKTKEKSFFDFHSRNVKNIYKKQIKPKQTNKPQQNPSAEFIFRDNYRTWDQNNGHHSQMYLLCRYRSATGCRF